jgi:Nucleotidyl transferase AbiEii toxin, Type IV TA system
MSRSASVLARLLNGAKARGEDYNLVLNRFVLERLLYRLSISKHAERFLLKGAMLFALWFDVPHRPTRDADLLGFGPDDAETLLATFQDICAIAVGDGVVFHATSISVAAIREDQLYGGRRLTLRAAIGNARLAVQVDVGFGDAVTPIYPTLLDDLEAPRLRVYPVYTVIAEKFEAMVQLGMANSRMKDFFDLAVIARNTELDGATLANAIRATFARRGTAVPREPPIALTDAFAADPAKLKQWRAFTTKSRLDTDDLPAVVEGLRALLQPPVRTLAGGGPFDRRWMPDAQHWR